MTAAVLTGMTIVREFSVGKHRRDAAVTA